MLPEKPKYYFAFGSALHAVMEFIFNPARPQFPTLPQALDFFDSTWSKTSFEQKGYSSAEKELEGKVDIITMWHVIEHLEDPIGLLKKLKGLLKPNGKIIIETPNAEDALLSQYKCDAFADFTYWECHLYLFTNATIRTVIENAGLRMIAQKQIQRYPLANHLYWLTNGKPGGHKEWGIMNEAEVNNAYAKLLASMGCADTLIVECCV